MSRILIGSIAPNIHGLDFADELKSNDEFILYDKSVYKNRKATLSDFCAGIKSLIPTIPYVFDYEDANFAKIKAAYIEGRPSSMNCRGNMLQLTSCTEESAEFYGFSMASNLGIISIKPWYAKVNSDGTKTYSASNSYFPFPGSFYFKLTESNGVLSANDSPHDFAFVDIYGMPVTIEYNNTLYDYREHKRVGSSYVQYFYAITSERSTTIVHELTRTTSGSTVTWAHRTLSLTAGTSGEGGVTVDVPTRLSELENDSGFVTATKLAADLASKQDTITDLDTIRSGAAKGATALQTVPSTYRTASAQDTIDSGKVDKVTGKGLSTNDYTAADKAKVDAIPASPKYTDTVYDDTAVKNRLTTVENKVAGIEAGSGSGFSGSYNDLTDKPTIPDAVTEGTVSGWGFTKNTGTYSKPTGGIPKADLASAVQTSLGKADSALQTVPSTYRTASAQDTIDSGKVDKVTGKGLSTNDYTAADKAKVDAIPASPKYTDTVYDDTAVKNRLTTVENKVAGIEAGSGSGFSGSYNDLTDKPTIPDAVTEGTVSGWGFTKNTGTYSKPTGGIPKADLASAVQTSLGKADSALQTVPSTYRTASAQDTIDKGKVDKVTGKGLSTNDYTNAAKAKVDAIPASPKYTDTVYNDTAVKNRLTAIENKENVTLTPNAARVSNVSYTAKYFPLLGMVFVRIYGKINAALNAGYDYDLFSIDSRVPDSNVALSVKCGKNAMALAKTSSSGSAIQIRPLESGINGYDVYITGFWFV